MDWLQNGLRECGGGDGMFSNLIIVMIVQVFICQNSLNHTLKMNAFNGM